MSRYKKGDIVVCNKLELLVVYVNDELGLLECLDSKNDTRVLIGYGNVDYIKK